MIIVIGGIVALTQSQRVLVQNLNVDDAFKGTRYSFSTLGMAFYQGLWSYSGWYNLNYVIEELKKPQVRLSKKNVDFTWKSLFPYEQMSVWYCELPHEGTTEQKLYP